MQDTNPVQNTLATSVVVVVVVLTIGNSVRPEYPHDSSQAGSMEGA